MGIRLSKEEAKKLGIVPPKKPAHTPGVMNKLESKFAAELEAWKQLQVISWYDFEPIKLRLAKATYYTPDFAVFGPSLALTFYECKGFWRQSGRIKIKIAAEKYPVFRFVAVQWVNNQWKYEEF